jgi:DNA-binding FrmR family transcriptional regulator
MSIFSKIASAAKTAVNWLEQEFTKIEGNIPAIETMIEVGVKYSVSVLKIVLSQVEAASPAAKILSTAIQDLLTLSAVAFDAGAHPSLATEFQAIVNNLAGLESATGIKNATTLGTVQKVVSTISAIAAALLPAV